MQTSQRHARSYTNGTCMHAYRYIHTYTHTYIHTSKCRHLSTTQGVTQMDRRGRHGSRWCCQFPRIFRHGQTNYYSQQGMYIYIYIYIYIYMHVHVLDM